MVSNELEPQSSVDRRILRLASQFKSPQEISEELAGLVTPQEAYARTIALLGERDVWSEEQKQQLLMQRVLSIVDHMQERIELGDDKAANTAIRGIKVVVDQLNEYAKRQSEYKLRVSEFHARVLVSMVEAGLVKITETLKVINPEFDELSVDDVVLEVMPEVLKEITVVNGGNNSE